MYNKSKSLYIINLRSCANDIFNKTWCFPRGNLASLQDETQYTLRWHVHSRCQVHNNNYYIIVVIKNIYSVKGQSTLLIDNRVNMRPSVAVEDWKKTLVWHHRLELLLLVLFLKFCRVRFRPTNTHTHTYTQYTIAFPRCYVCKQCFYF